MNGHRFVQVAAIAAAPRQPIDPRGSNHFHQDPPILANDPQDGGLEVESFPAERHGDLAARRGKGLAIRLGRVIDSRIDALGIHRYDVSLQGIVVGNGGDRQQDGCSLSAGQLEQACDSSVVEDEHACTGRLTMDFHVNLPPSP